MLPSHDDLLFCAQLLTGFHALLCLGEMVFSDKKVLHNYQKFPFGTLSNFLHTNTLSSYPIIKVIVPLMETPYSSRKLPPLWTLTHLFEIIYSLVILFSLSHPKLWLTSLGHVPTHHWFIKRLQTFFPKSYTGHSLRSGGATSLAECFHHSGCWMVELLLLPDFHSEAPCCATCTHLWASSPPTCPLAFSYFSFPLMAELTSHISSPHFT
jgi:hypothetical protein